MKVFTYRNGFLKCSPVFWNSHINFGRPGWRFYVGENQTVYFIFECDWNIFLCLEYNLFHGSGTLKTVSPRVDNHGRIYVFFQYYVSTVFGIGWIDRIWIPDWTYLKTLIVRLYRTGSGYLDIFKIGVWITFNDFYNLKIVARVPVHNRSIIKEVCLARADITARSIWVGSIFTIGTKRIFTTVYCTDIQTV